MNSQVECPVKNHSEERGGEKKRDLGGIYRSCFCDCTSGVIRNIMNSTILLSIVIEVESFKNKHCKVSRFTWLILFNMYSFYIFLNKKHFENQSLS